MPVYLLATLKAKYGQLDRFSEVMKALVPVMEAQGWKLIGAYQAIIGDLTQVVDLWELPDANAVGAGLAAAAAGAGFEEIAAVLAEVVEDEVLQVMAKTSYSP
jgi:hypothetical protein